MKHAEGKDIQAWLDFDATDGTPIVMRVATSAVDVEGAKKNLDVYRQKVDIDKNTLLLETNWDKVNEERKAQGLAKISNESMRKAYIDSQLVQEKRDLNTLIVEYETLLRIYDAIKE